MRVSTSVLLRLSWVTALLLWLGNGMHSAQASLATTACQQAVLSRRPALQLPTYAIPPEAVTPSCPLAHPGEAPVTGASGAGWTVLPPEWRPAQAWPRADYPLKAGRQTGPVAPCQRQVVRVALSPQAP